jgi:hypothetical protein
MQHWNRSSVAQFEENTMGVCLVSNPQLTPTQSTMDQTFENLVKAIQDLYERFGKFETMVIACSPNFF